jgi:hypothetical protein
MIGYSGPWPKTEAGFRLIWCSTASKATAEYGEMLVAQFHAHQAMDQRQRDQSQHHGASVLGRDRDPCRKYRIGTVVVASTPAAARSLKRCRGRMRGANALCDLVVFGLAPPTSPASQVGREIQDHD